jgi:hypothetical protein
LNIEELLLIVAVGAAPTRLDVTAGTLPALAVEVELEADEELESVGTLVVVAIAWSEEVLSFAVSVLESPPLFPLFPELLPPLCDAVFKGEGEASVEVIDGVVGPSRL